MMKVLGFVLIFCIAFGAVGTASSAVTRSPENPKLEISAGRVEQGDTLVVRVSDKSGILTVGTFNGTRLNFFRAGGAQVGIVGIDAKAEPGIKKLFVILPSGEKVRRDILIKRRSFPTAYFTIPPSLAERGTTGKDIAQKIATVDKPTLDSVFKKFTARAYFSRAFQDPLARWIDAGGFGVIRASPEGSLRHLGVDLAADIGTEAHAVNDGVVSFAGDLPNYGTTVVVDHGLGIYSAYLHLSEAEVKANQSVKKGGVIGKTGESGDYVFHPHLHFSMKVAGASVDPRRFLDTVNQFLKY